jgi:DNA-binding transcriptional LysR family regulator
MVSIEGKTPPLEGLYYFARVVDHGGYAKASRALGIPKSRLSRHVAALESQLNVRLLNRSTRRFVLTEVGREVHGRALAMLSDAEAALEAAEVAQTQPRGLIKVSAPIAVAQTALAVVLPDFLQKCPAVRLQLHVSDRRVDVLNEGFDVALRVRARPSGEDALVMRSFSQLNSYLVASPAYLDRVGRVSEPAQLYERATLGFTPEPDRDVWELIGPNGESARIEHTPRVCCQDFVVLRAAVLAGLGIALLPQSVVGRDIAEGRFERVLPQWRTPQGILHVVFPSRRGLLPAVRAFVDFLAERLPGLM